MGYIIRISKKGNCGSPESPKEIDGGPGTELKKILARWGIRPGENCACTRRAKTMDQNGPRWCEQNLDKIVGWLKEEANNRKLPFINRLGKILVRRAIRNSQKKTEDSAERQKPQIVHNQTQKREPRKVTWSYGVTTVPQRIDDLLPRTLASLAAGGFDKPRLFVDGEKDVTAYEKFGLEVTVRNPQIQTFGNWILALWELYLRNSEAEKYAVFQDDFVTYINLRQYLESCKYPAKGYWNLNTFPENQKLAPKDGTTGWFESNQNGRSAVALVFSSEAVVTLLESSHLVRRSMTVEPRRKYKMVDGGIVESFRKVGWKEYTHNPTLVEHTGMKSMIRSRGIPDKWKAKTFRGEDFDAMELLK